MTNARRSFARLALCLGSVFFASSALAQAPAPTITPPSVISAVDGVYPQAALDAARGEVVVPLRIVIEEDGTVSDATVVDSRGDGLDEAAVAAIRQFQFEPARRNGAAIRIAVRFDFTLRPPPVAEPVEGTELEETPEETPVEPPPPPPGRIVGQLLDSVSNQPLADVDVTLSAADGSERIVTTDAEGRFVFDAIPAGDYRVIVRPIGLPERVEQETVAEAEELAVTYRVLTQTEEEARDDGLSASAVIDPPPREVTRRTVPREEMMSIPGTRGDPLRAIEILPGVARPPFGLGLVIVRGSAPGDTEILLDGVPIPLLYHFGGLTSVFNGRLLERIDFYPGNFSSRYGRKMGGIIEVDTRDPRTDRIHGNVETSVIDASIMLEGPISRRFSIAGSVRRSVIDAVFGALVPNDVRLTAAPVYYDYQLFATWRPTDADRVRFRLYGSDDRFRVFVSDEAADDPGAQGPAGLGTRYNYFQVNWERKLSPSTEQEIVFQTGPQNLRFNFGRDFQLELQIFSLYGRAEWRTNVSEHLRVVAGVDVSAGHYDILYRGLMVAQSEGNVPDQTQDLVRISESGFVVRPSAYVDTGLSFGRFYVNAAARADYYSEIRGWSIDPRLVVNYRVNDAVKLKAGAGLFSQPPEFQESSPGLGNPNLDPLHSAHFGTGVDWTVANGIELGVEGFYKQLWNRVVQTPGGVEPRFENAGIGRIYGMELSGRIRSSESRPYFGYLSYTLMRSERRDHGDQPWRLFDYDQTHIFTAAFSYQFRRHHWELGTTLRIVSGNPYTPVTGSVFDPVSQSYYPINGLTNSARNPLFNRLDIRVEKQWWFPGWKLALFLDLQNAYNRANAEGITYNYDYTRSGRISGLPIIPGLGLRGEF